jgi:hypothetical protein
MQIEEATNIFKTANQNCNECIPPWITKCMTPNELESTMDAVPGAETHRASGINCEILPAVPCTSFVNGCIPLLLD